MGRKVDKEMHCHKCKKEYEEVFSFTKYGSNRLKVEDDNWYCEEHFEEVSNKYDNIKSKGD